MTNNHEILVASGPRDLRDDLGPRWLMEKSFYDLIPGPSPNKTCEISHFNNIKPMDQQISRKRQSIPITNHKSYLSRVVG